MQLARFCQFFSPPPRSCKQVMTFGSLVYVGIFNFFQNVKITFVLLVQFFLFYFDVASVILSQKITNKFEFYKPEIELICLANGPTHLLPHVGKHSHLVNPLTPRLFS